MRTQSCPTTTSLDGDLLNFLPRLALLTGILPDRALGMCDIPRGLHLSEVGEGRFELKLFQTGSNLLKGSRQLTCLVEL